MNHTRYQKLRKTLLYLWFMVMPITFNWMSPVLIIVAGFQAVINMSYIIFGLWFLSSLIFGRAYCAFACQWGAIQEIFGYTVPKKLHPTKKAKARAIKYFVFAIWIVFVVLGPILAGGFVNGTNVYFPNLADEDGRNTLFSFSEYFNGGHIFYFGIQITLAIFFGLLFGCRSFCNYGCPMAVFGIIGTKFKKWLKYPSLHLESNKETCIKCGKCSKACPMSLDVKEMVQNENMMHDDCILCGSCIEQCPKSTISYAWKWPKNKKMENSS